MMNLIKILLFAFELSQTIILAGSTLSKSPFYNIPNELYLIKPENIKFRSHSS